MATNITDFIKAIVLPLADKKDQVVVTTEEQPDFLVYDLHVSSKDAGRIIGKQGRVAQAIRTIVYSQNHDTARKIKLNIIPEADSE